MSADDCQRDVSDSVAGELRRFLTAAAAGRLTAAQSRVSARVQAAAGVTDVVPRRLAQGCAMAGQPVKASVWLEAAVARGVTNYPFLARHDPSLAPLRADPRFQGLPNAVRTRWQHFEA